MKLALSDEILLQIEKPARYIGNEINAVIKDPSKVDIRFAMCFPDVYEIGMSHLGIQILYDMMNQKENVYCERVYSPWPDLHKIMKERRIPLFALESQQPIKDFDFVGITLQYEMCYTNVLQILDLGQIPLLARERGPQDPFVIGGGPCAYNPEPLAEFFDLFYLGEGEVRHDELFSLYVEWKKSGRGREQFLRDASHIPGIYVPSLYEVSYAADGTIAAMAPHYPDVPSTVQRQVVRDLTHAPYPKKPVVPFLQATQDRVMLEVQRGCIRGCRFCQAGMTYRPLREKNVAFLKRQAMELLENTGYDEISLSSLSTSDYRALGELAQYLVEQCSPRHINISLPSLRIDAFSLNVMGKVQDVRKSSLTFAPEAGSQRLRDVINKGLTEESILHGAGLAFEGGWNKVKLYFMLGLPTETQEDMRAIAKLANQIAARYYEIPKEERHGKCQITVSTSFFVPKPFTPFQWSKMCSKEDFLGRAKVVNDCIKEQLNRKSIKYNWHQADVTVLEGILARGDRRLCKAILRAYQLGCLFDAWSEQFHGELWDQAFLECGIDPEFYTTRERSLNEILPWDFIDIGVGKDFLIREWENAKKGVVTPNCRERCAGCGANRHEGGVCYENQG